jgi:hypothetical protein
MTREKILIRDDHKIKITVSLRIDHRDTTWIVDVEKCEKGKRTWVNVIDYDSYEYRRKSMPEREKYEEAIQLLHVTTQEISDTKEELINRIPY